MKRAMFIFCGICWLGFGLVIGIISWPYLEAGAGGDSGFVSQLLASVTLSSVLIGLVHLVGVLALILACLGIGLNLLLRGLFPAQK
jgi:hypothetical protein